MPGITEEELKQYKVLHDEYMRLIKELKDIYKKVYKKCRRREGNLTANYSNEPRPANKQPILSFPEALKFIKDNEKELIKQIRALEAKLYKYEDILILLAPEERDYIYYRYYAGMQHQQTARLMGYTKDGADKVRSRALKKLQIGRTKAH